MRYFQTLLILAMSLVGCTSLKTTVSQSVDLSKYQYVSVISDNHHSHAAMDAEVKIYDAIENARLQLVGEQAITELSPEQRQGLLFARYNVTLTEQAAIVTVNFADYYTGRPVVSCQSEYSKGLDKQADLNGAIKLVAKQIVETFPKK
jgi:hypothetical protein